MYACVGHLNISVKDQRLNGKLNNFWRNTAKVVPCSRSVHAVFPVPLPVVPSTSPVPVSPAEWSKPFHWLHKSLHLPGILQTWVDLGPSQIPLELNSRTSLEQENTPGLRTGLNSPKSL